MRAVLGTFEFKKGDLGGSGPQRWRQRKETVGRVRGRPQRAPRDMRHLCTREAHGVPAHGVSAQALHTSIVVTEAHELNSPPPTGEEGGCWSCHLLSFLPPPSNPQRTFLYLEGTVL